MEVAENGGKTSSVCKVEFRETGNSLLMGLVKVAPDEFPNYENELKAAVADWRENAKREVDTATPHRDELRAWSDFEHYFQTHIFSTLGSWDVVHFTMTFDYGLASRLPYIGHAIGQQMYYLHDMSLKMRAETKQVPPNQQGECPLSLFEALEHIGVTYCFCHDSYEEQKAATQSTLKEEILISRDVESFNEQGSSTEDIDLVGQHYYTVVKSTFDLNNIASEKITSDSSKEKRRERIKVDPTNLLSVFQLNKNPNHKLEKSYENRVIIYLFMVYKLARFWIEHDENKEQITFAKPFFTDNFFDIAVIFRGTNFNLMKKMMAAAMTITEMDVEELHRLTQYVDKNSKQQILFDRGHVIENFVTSIPLFHLHYNFEGFPYPMIKSIQSNIRATFKDHCCLENGGQVDACHKDQCDLATYKTCVKRAYGGSLGYKEKLGSFNGETDLVKPSILIALQTDYQKHVYNQLALWQDCTKEIFKNTSIEIEEVQGRYAIEIRFTEPVATPTFILIFSFLTNFLPQECNRKTMKLINFPVETRKIHNPILQFKTKLYTQLPSGEELENRGICHSFSNIVQKPYKGNTCLLNKGRMLQICYDAASELQNVMVENPTTYDYDVFFNRNSTILSSIKSEETRRDIVKKVQKNLCYSIYKFQDTEDDKPFQNEFNKYLQKRFRGEVTPETIELLFSTLCALDSFISNQISYYLFLDVRRYAMEFITLLCSVHQCRDDNGQIHDVYWNAKRFRVEVCKSDSTSIIKGLEYQITTFISTVEIISSQKLSGSYPQHDRNFSRLADIRVLQNKKIEAISWLINSCCSAFTKTYSDALQRQAAIYAVKGKLTDSYPHIPHHLPVFSNCPDMILSPIEKTIGINVRNLASIEGLTLVTHEIGHILANFLLDTRDAKNNTIFKGTIFDKEKQSVVRGEVRKKECVNLENNQTCGPNTGSVNISSAYSDTPLQEHRENIKRIDAETLDQQLNKHISKKAIFVEIFADLYNCNLCFAPLEKFYQNNSFIHLCPGLEDKNISQARVTSYKTFDDSSLYDQIDDFCLSFIHQVVRLPQILSEEGFYNLMLRITFMVGLVKLKKNCHLIEEAAELFTNKAEFFTNKEAGKERFEKICGDVRDKLIAPFYTEKLLLLLETLFEREVLHVKKSHCSEPNATIDTDMGKDYRKYGGKVQQPLLLNNLRFTIKEKKGEYINDECKAFVKENFFEKMHFAFTEYLTTYLKGCCEADPFFLYMDKLASLKGLEKQIKEGKRQKITPLFQKFNDPYLVRQGLAPQDIGDLEDELDCFSNSLQLCGAINLRFSASTNNHHLVTHGNLGFKGHPAQQYLSRSRRLATTYLWSGALKAIKNEVDAINKGYETWWRVERDEEGRDRTVLNTKMLHVYKRLCQEELLCNRDGCETFRQRKRV